ncbi:glycoside hydrolase family 61 protein [Ceratobasidium sp. AG-Ba]|nr:glycoside hydrolase family 61 protein [Ceratobasidium sp. AG-Ba]
MKPQAIAASLALFSAQAAAHTIFQELWVNGVSAGHLKGIRYPTYDGPITDVTSNDIICNGGPNPLVTPYDKTVINVPAGATITHEWHHTLDSAGTSDAADPIDPGHLGPVMVYLAKIPDATQTDVTGLKWFKIAEDGFDSNGVWGVTRLFNAKGKATAVIPKCIPSGNYLLRAEIIALHAASSYPGAQFYMECAQINVTGGGSASPATVSFPGAYSGTDPGVKISIYYPPVTNYTIPGPRPFTCDGSSPVSTTPAATTKPVTTSTPVISTTAKPTTTSSSAPPTTTGTVAKYGQCGGIGYTPAMKTTCASLFVTLLALAIPQHVQAHGFIKAVKIGGSTFKGLEPASTAPNNSPIRAITDQSPVKNLQSKDMICGFGATPGTVVASAKPGDSIEYTWANAVTGGNWIHDTGPMMTYMAQVPAGQTADKFDGAGAKWFKTDQVGKKNNKWVQGSLMTGATFKTKMPETLADGDYLVRHEIIALHNAGNKGGAEFYPTCLQVRIKNSNAGEAAVEASPTVSFPGAYSATDPGILVDVFSQAADGSEYKFPAGPIADVTAPGATGNAPGAAEISVSSSVPVQTSTTFSVTSTSAIATPTSTSSSVSISVTPTSTFGSFVSTTTSAAPSATPSDLAAIRLANGRTAQELNLRFKTLAVTEKCEPRDPGCIDGEFAVCTPQGTWAKQGACFTGASCFAVPLANINGTQVGCFPQSVVEQALIDSGVGRAIATETATSTSTSTGSLATSATTTTGVASGSASTTSATAKASSVIVTAIVSTLTPISTPVASSTSSSASISTAPLPSATPVNNNSGAPAVVIGIGSKPARRMLRWERRGFY